MVFSSSCQREDVERSEPKSCNVSKENMNPIGREAAFKLIIGILKRKAST